MNFLSSVFLRRLIALHDVQLSEANVRLDLASVTTTNGVLIWKITRFSHRRQDAVSLKTPSLFSPPFHTSPAGYRLCARLYPNGDGIGRGTHLSLFIVVMKGEFDSLLPWPFRQKVTLSMLNQNRTGVHVVETFRPDPASSSFQRPEQEMNIASGCPLFFPIANLSNASYLRDDTLFFKLQIDTTGLDAPDYR